MMKKSLILMALVAVSPLSLPLYAVTETEQPAEPSKNKNDGKDGTADGNAGQGSDSKPENNPKGKGHAE